MTIEQLKDLVWGYEGLENALTKLRSIKKGETGYNNPPKLTLSKRTTALLVEDLLKVIQSRKDKISAALDTLKV